MMTHDFNELIERRGTDAKKYSPDFYAQDVLPMWIADTDFKCPEPIVDAACRRAAQGVFGYPYNQKSFADAACHWLETRFGYSTGADSVEFTPGVIPGVIYAVRAFSHPGDKIVLQTPAYPPFYELIRNNGRHVAANPLVLMDGRYEIDLENLESQLKDPRARVMILCNPHNPTGRVFTRQELERILSMCIENDVFLISDEIHCDITFKGHRHIPILSVSPDAAKHAALCISPSKTFNTAGFRTSALIAPDKQVRGRIYQALASNKGYGRTIFGALSFTTAYMECAYYADQLMEYLTQNLGLLREALGSMPKIRLIEPEATYLMWLDCRETGFTQEELVHFFTQEAKVGLNSGTSFGEEGRGFMRLNIACPSSVLLEGIERISRAYFRHF